MGTDVFLLIWFWLYAGCLFCTTMMGLHLFDEQPWWKKTLFWPYFVVVYYVRYLKIKKMEKYDEQ